MRIVTNRAVLAVIAVCFCIAGNSAYAQLNVDPSLTPEQMVDVLVGEGVTPSNISYTGATVASGKFWGETNIGMDEGVLLTSGKAEFAKGPNNSGSKGHAHYSAGDPDLTSFAGFNTNDACILEFDFIPQSSVLQFNYTFGSEEYPEYSPSNYNDAFGFFISGPGINGTFSNNSKNIAIIPFTNPPVYVTINNVNPTTNPAYYVSNSGGQTIQYDGFTVVMPATAVVTPCSTYHIKLAIADGVDEIYDSGVFLEANSFSSVGLTCVVNFNSQYIDTIAVENCNNALLTFELDDHALEDFYIPLQIAGTAQNGIDYDTIPDTLLIPQGYRFAFVDIVPFEDALPEGYETVSITYNSSLCEPNYETVTFKIYDDPEFIMQARDDTIAHCADSVRLYTLEDGGMPPYFYNWYVLGDTIPFDTIPDPIVNPYNPTTYLIKQLDACGDTLIDTVFVDIIGPTAIVSPDTSICEGDSATLIAGGGTSYLWSPTGDTTAEIKVSPLVQTEYTVTVYDDCNNSDEVSVIVYVANPQAYAGEDTTICIGDAITLTAGGGLYYEWSTGELTQSITVSPTSDECYTVYVTDDCDNTAEDEVCVFVNAAIVAEAGDDQTICFGETTELTATGGVQYEWSNGENTQTIEVQPDVTTIYYVTVSDGCSDIDSVTVFVDPLPDVLASAATDFICFGDTVQLNAAGADSYEWTAFPPDGSLTGQENLPNPNVFPAVTTTYTLKGTDNTTTCENETSITITVKDELLSTINADLFEVCTNDDVTIFYLGNALPSATYDWNFDGGAVSGGTGAGPYTVSWSALGPKEVSLKVFEDGCESDSTKLTITINPTPQVDFSALSQSGCEPFEVEFSDNTLEAVPGATYIWDFGTGDQSNDMNPVYTFQNTGTYDVSLTVRNGDCEDVKISNGFITVHPLPVAGFNVTPALTSIENPTVSLSDQSNGNPTDWIWNLGDGSIIQGEQNPNYSYHDTGSFDITLVVYNIFGCTDSMFKTVVIKPHPRIYMPNAFAPSSTIGNDRFKPVGLGIEKFKMIIMNRWGEQIFETSKITEGWDGMVNGKPAPMGTYVYHISYTNNLQQSEELTGTVMLVR